MRKANSYVVLEAYTRQGWSADGGSRTPAVDEDDERRRVFAAGVEAGILYAMGHAGDPFNGNEDI